MLFMKFQVLYLIVSTEINKRNKVSAEKSQFLQILNFYVVSTEARGRLLQFKKSETSLFWKISYPTNHHRKKIQRWKQDRKLELKKTSQCCLGKKLPNCRSSSMTRTST